MELNYIISSIRSAKLRRGDIVSCDKFFGAKELTIMSVVSEFGKTLRVIAKSSDDDNAVIGPANNFNLIKKCN